MELRPGNYKYLTTAQAARHIGRSRWTIHSLVRNGKLPAIRTPLGFLYQRRDLDRCVRERAQKAAGLVPS
jgi:excisionase family DNA binding protein